ncbi:hypothetical protein HED51_11535 [Ochrobactrum grignonense]|nr:hypothetical protein [Brucella grignonensis]
MFQGILKLIEPPFRLFLGLLRFSNKARIGSKVAKFGGFGVKYALKIRRIRKWQPDFTLFVKTRLRYLLFSQFMHLAG